MQRCNRAGCGHDISSHYAERKAISSPTGERVIVTQYHDCLAMYCVCRGFIPESPEPYEPDDDP